MKKAFASLLAMLRGPHDGATPQQSKNQRTSRSNDYNIVLLEDGTAKIVRYSGKESSLSIPDKLKGYTVTDIGDGAFSKCRDLISVIIPNSVTGIGDRTFSECWGLRSVTIPDSVKSIGDGAFFECRSLSSVAIPNSVTIIGDNAFNGCDMLTLTVGRDSYAKQYAIQHNIPFLDRTRTTMRRTTMSEEEFLAAVDILVKECEWHFQNADNYTYMKSQFEHREKNIVRPVGERLNQIGGLSLMQSVYERVEAICMRKFGKGCRSALDMKWNGIGDWMS